PLVVLDSQPHHQRWTNFAGVVVAADASIDLVLSGLEAALRGEWLRQPVERTEVASALPEAGFETEGESSIELRDGTAAGEGTVITVLGGHGAPGRSTVALNLAALLGRVAATVLVDVD